jgi:RNA polymerase sigma-70 factor, ECF subfamily
VIDRAALDRWMAAAADGDRTAIAPLFQALWPVVVGYTTRLIGDHALAEDCAQDALVQLFGQIERYDRERDALTWALTLATWQCRTVRRRRTRRREVCHLRDGDPAPAAPRSAHGSQLGSALVPGLGPELVSIDGASMLERRDLVRAALAALDTLSAADIETITLAINDAERAAIAPATFRKRLERALSRLRTSWRSRHGTL